MRIHFGVIVLFVLFSANAFSQNAPGGTSSDSALQIQSKTQTTNSRESSSRESGAPSAPASVKLNTPTLNMDVLLDLYNKDIDFTIDYSGRALKQPAQNAEKTEEANETPKQRRRAGEATEELLKPREEDLTSDIRDIVDTSKVRKKQDRQGTYTKEDADYNKALYSLQAAQRLFSERKYQQALAQINLSIEAAPNMALAYAVRGSVFYMLRQLPDAKLSWEKALELDPSMDNVRAILYRM